MGVKYVMFAPVYNCYARTAVQVSASQKANSVFILSFQIVYLCDAHSSFLHRSTFHSSSAAWEVCKLPACHKANAIVKVTRCTQHRCLLESDFFQGLTILRRLRARSDEGLTKRQHSNLFTKVKLPYQLSWLNRIFVYFVQQIHCTTILKFSHSADTFYRSHHTSNKLSALRKIKNKFFDLLSFWICLKLTVKA